ncbi:MAG: ADOP family duplicated permease [Bryobacteraceae bacterium]
MPNLKLLLRSLFRKSRVEQDLDAELHFYLETQIQQRMDAGIDEPEARRAARIELGSVESVKDAVRDVRMGAGMERIWQDIRYAVRGLLNKPGYTVVAVLVLALGIGANSAVLSLVNAFLLKPLEVANSGQVVGLYSRDTKHPDSYRAFSYPNYVEIRDHNPVFSSVMAQQLSLVGVQKGNRTRRIFADVVSSNYFSTLGVPLLKGRSFRAEEEKPGAASTVIESYPFWKRTGGGSRILGRKLRINGHLFTVVGIAPKGFTGTTALMSPEIFLPLGAFNLVTNDFESKPLSARDNNALIVIGRLKPGITQKEANASLSVVASEMAKEFPAANKDQQLFVHSLSRFNISTGPTNNSEMYMPAILLMSLAGVVLLIACLNLANMIMASGAARRKEIAIRLAIGGSRRRIAQQLVTEGFVLAIVGGAAGLLVASWSAKVLMAAMARVLPFGFVYSSTPDVRVLAGTLAFCVASTVIFALSPAWKLSNPNTWLDLKATPGHDVGGRDRRFFSRGNVLVIAQLSLSLMMLAAAGLFVRSALRAANIQPGFSMRTEVLAEVDASLVNYDEPHTRLIYRTLRQRLRRIPGVQSVAMAATVPFGTTHMARGIAPSDAAASKKHPPLFARFNIVTADYFRTLRIPLLRGRPFTVAEDIPASKSHVAILDRAAAEKLWPQGGALGKYIRMYGHNGQSEICQVVGVAGNVRERIFAGKVTPHVYIPFGQQYQADMQIHVKATNSGPRMLKTIGHVIRATDKRLPLLALTTMRQHLDSSFGFWVMRTGAYLLEIFGAVALFLAVIGLYAVNAYTVARRTREIGIRMALGADPSSAMRLILGQGLRVIAAGVAIGLLLSIGIDRVLAGLLYQTRTIDPLVLLIASLVLALVALFACYLPARRASRVDPMVALRYE